MFFFPLDKRLVHCRLPPHIHFKLIFQAGGVPKIDLVLRDTTQRPLATYQPGPLADPEFDAFRLLVGVQREKSGVNRERTAWCED